MRAERRGGRGAAAAHVACRRGPEWGSMGRGAAYRANACWLTANMPCMVVTFDVSQLEMSTLNSSNLWQTFRMSVTPETSQSAMGPYVAAAAAESALYASTAILREAVVVKAACGETAKSIGKKLGKNIGATAAADIAPRSDRARGGPVGECEA